MNTKVFVWISYGRVNVYDATHDASLHNVLNITGILNGWGAKSMKLLWKRLYPSLPYRIQFLIKYPGVSSDDTDDFQMGTGFYDVKSAS